MLVLTRKTSERIMIGDNVVVTVSKIQGNRVWIGLEAPESVRIVRQEIAAKPQKEKADHAVRNR